MDEPNPGGDRQLIDFVSSITGAARLRIEENLPHGFVRLKVAEAERRQAQHDIRSVEDAVTELVRNSRDAGAGKILVGFQKEHGRFRRITVLDDGGGIPEDMHQLVFEPRVTSKSEDFEEDRYGVHGRGMALFSIRSRAERAGIASSVTGLGTVINLNFDTEKVPERSDQATLPRLESIDGVEGVGPGPHNVARILLEMSVDTPGVDFYLGSFAEVLATVRDLAFQSSEANAAIWSGVAHMDDARVLAEASADTLGLPLSERNAYRVLGGEITPLEPILRLARAATAIEPFETEQSDKIEAPLAKTRVSYSRNPLRKLGKDDMDEIAAGASEVVEKVVERYYLKTSGLPRVRKGRGKIVISFYVRGEDGEEQ